MLLRQSLLLSSLSATLPWPTVENPLTTHIVMTDASNGLATPARTGLSTLRTHDRTTAMAKRTQGVIPMIACKSVVRHQQYAVLPTALGAATLQAFWDTLQLRSVYDEFFDTPRPLFTVTQGALQATFSCLGQAVPWDFVHDFSQLAAEGVRQGRLETFDAVYEQEGTGFVMMVSLRVVGRLVGKRKKRGG